MRYRLSHSSLELLHTCERKYQLQRLLAGSGEREESEHLLFGAAFGEGVQSYLTNQDKEQALFKSWLAYWPEIESPTKDVTRCLISLERAFDALDNLLMEYELVHFEDKPAVELSFRLNIDEDYYFVGYVDAVLRHRFTGQYVVFECKHTGLSLHDLSPLYKNSGQALGYSIALDNIVGHQLSSYGVLYFVAQLGRSYAEVRCHTMLFEKTLLDRLNWFLTLGLDVGHLKEMVELGVYPKRGSSCLMFMRPCMHFGTCSLHSFDTPKVLEEDTVDYQFIYQLDDLITDHLKRLEVQHATT